MHSQSDYGYTVGGVQHRDGPFCRRMAQECEASAVLYPERSDTFLRYRDEWLAEASYYDEHYGHR